MEEVIDLYAVGRKAWTQSCTGMLAAMPLNLAIRGPGTFAPADKTCHLAMNMPLNILANCGLMAYGLPGAILLAAGPVFLAACMRRYPLARGAVDAR